MRPIKLKRAVLIVVTLLPVIVAVNVLLAFRLTRSEGAADEEHVIAPIASNLPRTQQTQQLPPATVRGAKPSTRAAGVGLLRALLKQCAAENISGGLYESYFANRHLCNEPLLEELYSTSASSMRTVLFTLRTTARYHRTRLPLLFDTWLSDIGLSVDRQVAIITDARDEAVEHTAKLLGIDYVVVQCPPGHNLTQLCCKAGEELATVLKPPYDKFEWVCHVDDDMYVLVDVLVRWLSKLGPYEDHVYLGRPNSPWRGSQQLRVKDGATVAHPGVPFDFALGGLYCLSRAMLLSIAPYLGNAEAFGDVCTDVNEPDDVTLGIITGAVLKNPLLRTNLIHTHGQNLAATVDPLTLHKQIAISYGYGVVHWGVPTFNSVCVPNAMFNVTEDPSQFRSLHCFLHPLLPWCVQRQAMLDASPMLKVKRPGLHCLYW